jgi:hypothetical protein
MMTWPPQQQHLQALFTAYVEESGIPISPSYLRKQALREMDRRGLTAEDVRAVIRGIKTHVARGTHGYTDASLDWRNAMGDVDTFEERALKIRQARLRRKGAKPVPVVRHTTALPDGASVSRLAPSVPGTEVASIDVAKALREFADKLRGGGA